MYRQHFNLEKKPFQISSDNQFLWLGEKHAAALELLKQGIARHQGLLILTGDVGTGKTTLINEIIHTLDTETRSVVISDPCFEMHHLFLTIAQALGFEDQYQAQKNFSSEFASFLKTENAGGRKVVVLVDEAQRIPEEFLKEIVSWSEFKLNHVLTVILVGQLEFQTVLETTLGQGWRDEIKTHAVLEPLNENETKIYINKRLEFSGSKRKIFLISAIHEIHVYSKGFPRTINIACDQALIAAFAKGMRLVDVPTIKEALGQLDLPIIPSNSYPEETIPFQRSWFQKKSFIGGAVFVLICLFAGYLYTGDNGPFVFKRESPVPTLPMTPEPLLPKAKLPPTPDASPVVEQIPPSETAIESTVVQVQEPDTQNEAQNIETAEPPAASMEEKKDPSPVLINTLVASDQTTQGQPAASKDIHGFIEDVFSFKENLASDDSENTIVAEQGEEKVLPGPAEPFEENSAEDSPVLNEPEPEPDAIIDWLIHKRETE
jgi:type II secretory pathway predicted ATPase ExeA